jgi:antitoxin component YwqK of YwqJK toxin-antitoxin module
MVRKEHLRSRVIRHSCTLGILLCLGCAVNKKEETISAVFGEVDTSQIPTDTISSRDSILRLDNGIYFYNNKPFSGFIKEVYENEALKSIGSYYQGMQHGITRTFYRNGKARDSRSYKENVGYGRHVGYWENGNMKFDFTYYFDRREGIQKQWYKSGSPYAFLNFRGDREHGMQHAWRENGKPYINYEAKDGIRYGLQKSALCYTLKDEEVKLAGTAKSTLK